MRLFSLHVLGVRPECLHNRRRQGQGTTREWCSDGVAASSTACGVFGPVLAFRGEIEAQGRGSLHPHILVWLLGIHMDCLLRLLRRDMSTLRVRLRSYMRAVIAAVESVAQSAVQHLPRHFGRVDEQAAPLPFTAVEQSLSAFDGVSEVEALRQRDKRTGEEVQKESANEAKTKSNVFTAPWSDFRCC